MPRTVAGLACLAVIPVATRAPAIAALAVLAAIWIALIAYETVRHASYRAQVRAAPD